MDMSKEGWPECCYLFCLNCIRKQRTNKNNVHTVVHWRMLIFYASCRMVIEA